MSTSTCHKKYRLAIILLLLLSIFAVYGQVKDHEFLNFDDPEYVCDNGHVKNGLNTASTYWAFTTTVAANWHPITWMSHMLDVQLFGLNPAGHHLINVVFHAANAVLLFLLLSRITGTLWRSAAVAALFALHPLHVESVAWVAERKDVLSTFFGFLALHAYACYVKRKDLAWYIAVAISMVLSLMAKPMLVTLPFLMLLMDYWPLGRLPANNPAGDNGKQKLRSLIAEKIPFFLLAALSCVITLYAQQKGRAIASFINSPLAERVGNALISYVKYLGKTIWPKDLAPLYVYPEAVPFWQPVAAGLFLLVITVIAVKARRRKPYLLVGWIWYLLTLVPVIGIVQVGSQPMADRYTYLPLIGIFMVMAWGFTDLVDHPRVKFPGIAAAVAVLVLSSLVTWRQVSLWSDGITLYNHTLSVTQNNYLIHTNLGHALFVAGQGEEAYGHYREAIRINPYFTKAYLNLAFYLSTRGDVDEAVALARQAVKLDPGEISAYTSLAAYLLMKKEPREAIDILNSALKVDSGIAEVYFDLGFAYGAQGSTDNAIQAYKEGLLKDAEHIGCHYNLGVELYKLGRYDEAKSHFIEVLRLKPDQEMETMSRKFLGLIAGERS